jgi:ABC-type Na+ efflux pump permease subunit
MFIGPVFQREVAVAPRRTRTYISRAIYVSALWMLMFTAWLVLTGTQLVRDLGDLARFGMVLFQILSALQLALAVFFSAMLAASAVAQEKDRRTLELLLQTNLSNGELVLGKLLASVLQVLIMLAAALPVFMISALFGGVSFAQIARVFAVTFVSVLACGSLGSTIALWREKTFQALAVTVLALVLWTAVWEIASAGLIGSDAWGGTLSIWATGLSPWQAILDAARPHGLHYEALGFLATPANVFIAAALAMTALLNGVAIAKVRVWNPGREVRLRQAEERTTAAVSSDNVAETAAQTGIAANPVESGRIPQDINRSRTRHVWDNPILWREVRTWAYGRKILIIRLAYLVLFALAAGSLFWMSGQGPEVLQSRGAFALVPLLFLSLVLVNAQAVTALTNERDAKALDILLATDISPKEFVFGKLGGALYNTKEMILLPMLLCAYPCFAGVLSFENLVFLLGGLAMLYVFAAALGIHAGMVYENSRGAIATSLGTVFFLFLGVATCMRMMVAFSGSFQVQLLPFSALFLAGGMGLYLALGARNPSTAIGVASFLCPFGMFYIITSYLLAPPRTLGMFIVTLVTYGFTTAAMLVPAIYEFDIATGRTTVDE